MFSDIILHQTMSELHFYMDLTYHMLSRSHEGLPVISGGLPGLSVMCHDCNHDLHVIAIMSQCKCDDITHMM